MSFNVVILYSPYAYVFLHADAWGCRKEPPLGSDKVHTSPYRIFLSRPPGPGSFSYESVVYLQTLRITRKYPTIGINFMGDITEKR